MNKTRILGVFFTLGSFLSSKRTGKTKAANNLKNPGRHFASSVTDDAADSMFVTLDGDNIGRLLNHPTKIHIVRPDSLTLLSTQLRPQGLSATAVETPEEGAILSHLLL